MKHQILLKLCLLKIFSKSKTYYVFFKKSELVINELIDKFGKLIDRLIEKIK